MSVGSDFNQAYWLSKPPELRVFNPIDNPKVLPGGGDPTVMADREAFASDLAARGFIIDREIMIWEFDAYKTMLSREGYGYTWVPNAFQPASWAQVGGAPYDPANPLPDSIKVSSNIADYPPFEKANS